MKEKKFLIYIILSFLTVLVVLGIYLRPQPKDLLDITIELAFMFQPIVWLYLTRRYFRGQLYITALSGGFILFFISGILEILEEKVTENLLLDITEDGIMLIGIILITFAIIQITKITNYKLQVLSERNKEHYIDSIHDGLTNLYNKRYLLSNFSMIFNNNPDIFVNSICIFIDIDNFKIFNESQGHEVGDKLLAHLGELINSSKRKGDFAFRYGGEEFLIFYMNTHKAFIYEKLESMRKSFKEYTKSNFYHPESEFTLSIGTTDYNYGEELSKIIERADRAMYESKHSGKDRITTS